MADIIDAVTLFRPADPLRYSGDDPGLIAISRLPLQAGLATRIRTAIEAGWKDEDCDRYIEGWIESASDDPTRNLHRQLDALRRGLHPGES
jgi:hypothetical protein